MPRPPKARAPLKQAALQLFVKNGVNGTGIREISKHAKCSEAALYRHWSNKEDLVVSLFTEHLAEIEERMDHALNSTNDFKANLLACAKSLLSLYDEQEDVFRFIMLVEHEVAQQLPDDLRTPQTILVEYFIKAKENGDVKNDPVLLCAATVGSFREMASFVIYGRLPAPLRQYAEKLTNYIYAMSQSET